MRDYIDIGIVNNMPDSALQATKRQFLSLIEEAAGHITVHVQFYALDGIPRSTSGLHQIASYSRLEDLWNDSIDGLIVTGTEPRAADLTQEPYWKPLAQLMDWAQHNTASTVWSCLAAHAAVLHLDGIRRERLKEKRFGVFDCDRVIEHELTAGVPTRVRVPHSRWNDLPEQELKSSGYRILTRSDGAGVDSFVKEQGSLFVFVQGHPEYEAETLLQEYRRDLKRFLARESETYPVAPQSYFDAESVEALDNLKNRALSNRSEEVLADFPAGASAITNTWRSYAVRFYANWLSYLAQRKNRKENALSEKLHR